MLNRTLLYLRRKVGKTITLFILVFLISTFITTSFTLMYTTDEVSSHIRATLGAQIHIRQQGRMIGREDGNWDGNDSDKFLTDAILSQIMEISSLQRYNIRNSGHVNGLAFIEGLNASEGDNIGRIQGNHYTELFPDFSDQILELIEGRHITPADEHVVIISELLALTNELSIGDIIELAPAELGLHEDGSFVNTIIDTGISVQAEIVGIFTQIEVQPSENLQPTAGLVDNQLFSDHTLLISLGVTSYGEYETATFYASNPSYLPAIIDEIEQIENLNWDIFFIQYNDSDYMRIAGNLQTIQNLIIILSVVIGIVSVVILILILILRLRGRVHEVGILMSVGIPKKEILGQFLLEIMIISVFSFILSYVLSGLMVHQIEKEVLVNFQVMSDIGYEVFNTDQSHFSSMPLAIISVIYLFILSVILITAFISITLTIKLKPKQILAKMS